VGYRAILKGSFEEHGTLNFGIDPSVASEYATTPTLESSVTWDDQTLFDPQNPQMMTKSRMGNPSPVLWSQGGAPGAPVAPIPSSSPVHGVPGVSGQPQMINTGPTYGVPPDASLYHMSPSRSISLSSPMELASQYPNQYPPDFKRRVTSPSQNIGQIASPVIHSSSPSMQELQGAHIPVSFAGQPTPMGYQTWNMHGLPGPGVDTGSYSMFPSEPHADFNGQHMSPDAGI
jgi:hypothetical protein